MTSKKLINDPKNCVSDLLEGFVRTSSNDVVLFPEAKFVMRREICQNKVSIISGGGSGHEPFAAGYVGQGMLTAAVAGMVFASPPSKNVLAAIQNAGSKAGTLVFVINYTGDRLTFGAAVEKAKNMGMKAATFINGDDCATSDSGAGRRGMAGNVFLYKIAGAMSERGHSLEDILATLTEASKNISTFGIALTPCSTPGSKPTFTLADDTIELGLGVHGEHGIGQIKMCSASEGVEKILARLLDPNHSKLRLDRGSEDIAVLINNLGGLSKLEELIVANEAVCQLTAKGFKVKRFYSGHIMTSLEMSGVQISIFNLAGNSNWEELLDCPTDAPGWPKCGKPSEKKDIIRSLEQSHEDASHRQGSSKTVSQLWEDKSKEVVTKMCQRLVQMEEVLNTLDSKCGDGDCGSTMAYGAKLVMDSLDTMNFGNPRIWLEQIGSALGQMGGTSGGIYSLFLTAASGAFVGAEDDGSMRMGTWVEGLRRGVGAIMEYGGAKKGDRTLLDALLPALTVLETCVKPGTSLDKQNWAKALKEASEAARQGAESTRQIKASVGRASYVSQENLTDVDPGAFAVAAWMEVLARNTS